MTGRRPLSGDPIERFLADAERAARRGDRDLALDLIVLALDTAPSDPAVLVRAHSIRAMLPVAPEVAPPAADTEAPASSSSHKPEAPPSFDPVVPQAKAASDLFVPLPDLNEVRLDSYEEDIDFLLKPQAPETLAAEVTAELQPAQPRGRSKVVYLLWVLLAIGLLGALVVTTNPGAIDAASAAIRRTYDPFAKAEHLFEKRRYDETIALIRDRFAEFQPNEQVPARLILAEALLTTGDTVAAQRELAQAILSDTGWRDAFTAARLLTRANALNEAAGAYLLAFERGAPQEQWEEIANGQETAGRSDQALYIRQLINRESGVQGIERSEPDTVDAEMSAEAEQTADRPDSSEPTS